MDNPSDTDFQTPLVDIRTLIRFDWLQRLEHAILLVSFSTLGLTGLPQKYPTSPVSQGIIGFLGSIEAIRLIHHVAAIILMAVSILHIVSVLYRIFVLRTPLSMFPVIEDLKHLIHDLGYYIGIRARKAYYGRYSYAEKMEYLAVVWGTVVMAITGFMMWNPIATARWLPGEAIPAAKAAHGGEAVLAVLAIILWHFYHVHIRHFNKSMFTGQMTRQEMEHEHPAELTDLEAGKGYQPPAPEVIRKRQKIYFPVAGVLTLALSVGLVSFVTLEESSITTVPRGETAEVFVPLTPTPRPTPTITPTVDPNAAANLLTWEASIYSLLRNRCGSCHGNTAVGGLNLSTYQDALKGGKSGAGIAPGKPEASLIYQVQSAGGHPGQLSAEEIQKLADWIQSGAPEK